MNDQVVQKTLAKPDIHNQWQGTYETAENTRFYEQAFKYIAEYLDAPPDSLILDAGCGTASHAVQLVSNGFRVTGVDFSEPALELARQQVAGHGLQDQISLGREDLTSLTFDDSVFDYVLCWGVLMHIPNVEAAIAELCRVTSPGGMLVIGENNMRSLQSGVLGLSRRLRPSQNISVERKPSGIQSWEELPYGRLMTRQADVPWLIATVESHGFSLKKRATGQFTGLYSKVSSPQLRKPIYAFNDFWFKYVKSPGLAFSNILIFEKESEAG